MNWTLILTVLPVILEFIKKARKDNPKLTKSQAKKLILASVTSGAIKLPRDIPFELFASLLPIILDMLWTLGSAVAKAKKSLRIK